MNKTNTITGFDVVIDIVSEPYYLEEHISGAINICAYETAFVSKIEEQFPDKQAKICVYGPTGAEGRYAVEKLLDAGYENAAYLEGGLDKWSDDGGSVEISRRFVPKAIEDGIYHIDREKSFVKWTGRNKGNSHHGTIDCTNGFVEVIAGGVKDSEFSLDPHTIIALDLEGKPEHQYLIKHFHHSDFFKVKQYPSISFKVMNVNKLDRVTGSENNYDVVAELTMRGVKNKLSFEASIHPRDENTLTAQAHFDIDRTDWGMVYGSERFLRHLGMHVLKDEVSIELQLVFEKKE